MELGAVDPEETAATVLSAATGPVYLLSPTVRQLVAVVHAARSGDPPTVRVLAAPERLKRLRADFTVAVRATGLTTAGTLLLRRYDGETAPMVVGSQQVYGLLAAGGHSAHVANGGSFAAAARDYCRATWETAAEFDLRTPSVGRLRSSLSETFGAPVWADYETTLEAATKLRDRTQFDAVAAAVLVGARHEVTQRSLAKWAEEVGLASRATVSRTKRTLATDGVVAATDEGGREPARLSLTDEYAAIADDYGIAELVVRIV